MTDTTTHAKTLLELAAKATPGPWKIQYGALVHCPRPTRGFVELPGIEENLKYIAALSPDALIPILTEFLKMKEVVGEAREMAERSIDAMEMGAFHHNCCPWLNGKECVCAQEYKIPPALEKARSFLAKYFPKDEEG